MLEAATKRTHELDSWGSYGDDRATKVHLPPGYAAELGEREMITPEEIMGLLPTVYTGNFDASTMTSATAFFEAAKNNFGKLNDPEARPSPPNVVSDPVQLTPELETALADDAERSFGSAEKGIL